MAARRCPVATSTLPHAVPLAEVFIPSRDRALQLDGTLQSFRRQCSDVRRARIAVLFRATNRAHRKAYEILAREHPEISMVEEGSFAEDAARLLGAMESRSDQLGTRPRKGVAMAETTMLVVDDTLFVQAFSLESIRSALSEEPEALGFSLRLGETIRFCQPLDVPSPPPKLIHAAGSGAGEIVSFRWSKLKADWGYPLELSSSLYRRRHLATLVREITFDSPTRLEHELWLKSGSLVEYQRLLCYRRSRAVSLALNRVQSTALNPISDHLRHQPTGLLARYLEGWRIDVTAYDGYTPHACHEEAELILARGANP
jgi:hypothetical protein